jgi:arginyl-tRNA synthetase
MFYKDKLKNQLAKKLEVSPLDFTESPDIKRGHLSLPLFDLAKNKKINPHILAQEKAKFLNDSKDLKSIIKESKADGPYLNIFLHLENSLDLILNNILSLKSIYGNYPKTGKLSMIEFANQNTHKDLHIGHIRNISYGDCIFKLLKSSGKKTVAVSYINDLGINVAKTIWYLKRNKINKNNQKNKGEILGDYYQKAVSELEKNEAYKNEVLEIKKNIEEKKGSDYELWRESRTWSIDYFNEVYKKLNIKLDKIFYESQMLERGLSIVKDLLAKNILKISDKAVIADLRKDGLEVMPILRSDGTALYPVADLALAMTKFELYDLEESIYIIDIRQSLHFKQLFKILEKLKYKQKLTHLSYDFVKLKTGMMSSRSGNAVSFKEAYEAIYEKAKTETRKRRKEWSDKKIKKIANDIAISTLKFEMLKVSQDKTIVFDVESSLRFDGFTAVYLQYTGARINSLLKRNLNIISRLFFKFEAKHLKLEEEIALSLKLSQYPEKIKQSAKEHNPAIIARYLFDLCAGFNDYYQSVNILKSENKTKKARIALVLATKQVLENAFKVFGIKYLNKM